MGVNYRAVTRNTKTRTTHLMRREDSHGIEVYACKGVNAS